MGLYLGSLHWALSTLEVVYSLCTFLFLINKTHITCITYPMAPGNMKLKQILIGQTPAPSTSQVT